MRGLTVEPFGLLCTTIYSLHSTNAIADVSVLEPPRYPDLVRCNPDVLHKYLGITQGTKLGRKWFWERQ